MRFINPRTDLACKRIFGSQQSKGVLISFPNALLYNAQDIIADLEILNPHLAPKIRGMKEYVPGCTRAPAGRSAGDHRNAGVEYRGI